MALGIGGCVSGYKVYARYSELSVDDDDDGGESGETTEAGRSSNGTTARTGLWEGFAGDGGSVLDDDILDVLDKHLIPSAASGESKVFYHKMSVRFPISLWTRR